MRRGLALAGAIRAIAFAFSPVALLGASAQPVGPERYYSSIQELIARDGRTGFSSADRRTLKLLRERLVTGGAPTITFVMAKLVQMNDAENASNPSDCESALTPEASVENAPVKMELIEVLAQAYEHAGVSSRNDILRTLTKSYTLVIACDPHGGRTVLDWAFARIGRDSIVSLLDLGNSPLEPVRCAVYELIDSFAESARVPIGLSRPMKLHCRAEPEVRAHELADLRRWWLENGSKVRLPRPKGAEPGG